MDLMQGRTSSNKSRNLGCAVFVSHRVKTAPPYLLKEIPLPERSLMADASISGFNVAVGSFHTPPGASWGELKPQSHLLLANWLKNRERPVVLGIDANTP